jgi:hypothetical protein
LKPGGKEEAEGREDRGEQKNVEQPTPSGPEIFYPRSSAQIRSRLLLPPFTPFLRVSKILGFDCNNAIFSPAMLNFNLHVALLHKSLKLFSPFDEQDALWRHEIVERQRVELALGVDAVQSRDIRG